MRDTERNTASLRGAWHRRAGGQGGYSLVEVLLAVFLVGTVVLTLALGMLTLMRSTQSVSEQQRLEAAVLSFGEWLRSQDYVPCAGPGSYGDWTGPLGVDGEVVAVRHWQLDADSWGPGGFGAPCPQDLGRQLIDLTVRLDGGGEASAQVVLRDDV